MTLRLAFLILILTPALAPAKPGFFSVMQKDGRWWLADPKGQPFFCTAVNCIGIGPLVKDIPPDNPHYSGWRHYPSPQAWSVASLQRLKTWGFNTLGGFSDDELYASAGWPYTVALTFGKTLSIPWTDPGSPANRAGMAKMAAELVKYRGDANLIGYFIDNELGWWDETLTTYWLAQPSTERPKRQVLKMLKAEYGGDLKRLLADLEIKPLPGSWSALEGKLGSAAWKGAARPRTVEAFAGWLAEEFYSAAAAAIRKVDPDHLLLGDRYLSYYSPAVAAAAGRHMDVISANFNAYSEAGWVSPAFFNGLHLASGKPVMVTEFYFSAMKNASGNKNLKGPFILVPTQKERARGAAAMATAFAGMPFVVGHHWFQFNDEPEHGRSSDGEDFNFGLIDIHDRPYPLLTNAFSAANHAAVETHAASQALAPRTPGSLPRAKGIHGDGYLGDWDLGAAWLGPVAPSERSPSPTDFYAAWTPEGLWLALAYDDYDSSAMGDAASSFEIRIIRQAVTRSFKVSGFGQGQTQPGQRLIGNGPRFPHLKLESASPLKGSLAFKESVSVTRLAEIYFSKGDLGGNLKQGDELALDLGLTLKGAGRQWGWKGSLTLGRPWR